MTRGDIRPGDRVVFDTDVGLLVTVAVRGQALNVGDVVVVPYPYPVVAQEDLDSLGPHGMELDLQQVTKPYGQFDDDQPHTPGEKPGTWERYRDESYVCIFIRHIEREHVWSPEGYWEDEGFHQYAGAALFHLVVQTDSRELADLIVTGRLAGHGYVSPDRLLIDRADAA